ncbi:MAG: nicotinate (nicotinamide) nucleotide adenylyltransferase [Clostridia bacterium]|nr:nicotinate (nicotinamide) nucleotide adenylyltransferase [Clostridia bacterium]
MKLGIYGGTFSPVHIGHLRAAEAFKKQMDLDGLMIIPANIPPHKDATGILDAAERLTLCRLAFKGVAEVSDIEIRRGEKSYTVDTLEELKKAGCDDIYMLCGTDMINSFESWHRYKDIFKLATVVWAERYGDRTDETEEKIASFERDCGAKIFKLDAPCVEISSSEIRRMIKNGEDASAYLPKDEYDHIKKKGLYRD